ncbi:Enoyl-CoA delta isomerase 1, mitochondrial [Liparis tanakae]|uniref:Enoyl-CoA delta isomerase 1, mitochondrial n=1 Tax=Liparis tanakae TaxID=230148 RepID=A0A4Z2H781_9TELE|nr:Enoyl-CoA delta isomerase 1, mitochondrial [Liparis tanakae]
MSVSRLDVSLSMVGFLIMDLGSSPAGGCLMSMTCDYRIMADNPRYSIGLNETQLGIVVPFW